MPRATGRRTATARWIPLRGAALFRQLHRGGRLGDGRADRRRARDRARGRPRRHVPRAGRRRSGPGHARRGAADGVIQGTFFDDTGYGGSSLTVSGPELCKKDGWVNWQYDLDDDWKNRISSVQPWGNCAIWLYPEPNLGGDRDGPFDENTPTSARS
ncbi:hypothetical protein NKH77_02400 [Streptomyces sp. M19]